MVNLFIREKERIPDFQLYLPNHNLPELLSNFFIFLKGTEDDISLDKSFSVIEAAKSALNKFYYLLDESNGDRWVSNGEGNPLASKKFKCFFKSYKTDLKKKGKLEKISKCAVDHSWIKAYREFVVEKELKERKPYVKGRLVVLSMVMMYLNLLRSSELMQIKYQNLTFFDPKIDYFELKLTWRKSEVIGLGLNIFAANRLV